MVVASRTNWPSDRGSYFGYVPTTHPASYAVELTPYHSGSIYSMTEPRPTVHVPIAIGLLCLGVLLPLSFFVRSLYYLGENRLTVEVLREKHLCKLQADPSPKAQSRYESMRPLRYRWDPDRQQSYLTPSATVASWSLLHAQNLLGLYSRD